MEKRVRSRLSTERIIDRLAMLADQVELGQITVHEFADRFVGQIDAIEGLAYSQIKEAHQVRAQLRHAIDHNQEHLVDLHALGDWLRDWLTRVPPKRL